MGADFRDIFVINRPRRFQGKSAETLFKARGEEFCLINNSGVTFRGQFQSLQSGELGIFFGGPWIQSAEELEKHGLTLNDFSPSDPISMFLMILKYHEIANTELKEIQQLMNDHQIKAKELANLNQLLSEQKAQTEKARQRAEDLATEKSRFLSLMSHEIRTPLNGIIGGCDLLKNQELRADQVVPLQMMEESVTGLNNLVNRILEFSQLEDKAVSLQNEEVPLHTILQSTLNLFIRNAADKKLALSMEFFPGCPEYIHVDPHRFTQVLMNILENAVKFTQRGSIILRTQIIMSSDDSDGVPVAMRITVIDSGPGISHENQKRIFSFFEIGDSSNDRHHGGIGMGLAIVKHLMSLMEGSVEIDSRVGVGTQVILSWPFGSIMSKPVPSAQKLPPPLPERNGKFSASDNAKSTRNRILIVDDNRINQLLASKFLAKLGIDYDVAENGQIAIDKYKSGQFDMIFMDLQMPVLDGYGASLEIRQFDKNIPIIAISANARNEVTSQIKKAGMNEFLPRACPNGTKTNAGAGFPTHGTS